MKYHFQIAKLIQGIFVICLFTFTSATAFSEVIDLSSSEDTYVYNRRANNSYGSKSYMLIKETRRSQGYGLIRFNLEDIPHGSDVNSAKLQVFVTARRVYNNTLSIHEVLEDWNGSTKFSNRPLASSVSEDNVTIDSLGEYYELDVTAIVQDWVDGVSSNNGLQLAVSKGHIFIDSSEHSSNQPILTVSFDASDTPPSPGLDVPAPIPDPGILISDSGVSDAPLHPADKRIVVVAQDGSGNYRRIQDAVDRSRPGDTIQVKNGVYVERVKFSVNGTREQPITLQNYPDHAPVIDPGGGQYPPLCCHPNGTPRVQVNANWIIIEGFEIRHGWDGIKIYSDNVTIRNNWIHHNRYQGILIVSVGDIYIEGNTINNNGTNPGACFRDSRGLVDATHCHGIYISDYLCEGAPRITARGNTISKHGGGGVHWNGSKCSSTTMGNNLLENNIIEDNTWGMMLFFNVNDSVISNNTFVTEDIAEDYNSSYSFIAMWGSTGNVVKNNIFYSTKDEISAVMIRDEESTQNTFDYNLWNVRYEWWVWEGEWRSDFNRRFERVTGWGDNSWCCSVDPEFINVSEGDYRIHSDSPAVDTGTDEVCASVDFDLQKRVQGQSCDMGVDEVM